MSDECAVRVFGVLSETGPMLRPQDATAIVNFIGLTPAAYDELVGKLRAITVGGAGVERLGECGAPDCGCLVWSTTFEFCFGDVIVSKPHQNRAERRALQRERRGAHE